jgi:hypothetical protein
VSNAKSLTPLLTSGSEKKYQGALTQYDLGLSDMQTTLAFVTRQTSPGYPQEEERYERCWIFLDKLLGLRGIRIRSRISHSRHLYLAPLLGATPGEDVHGHSYGILPCQTKYLLSKHTPIWEPASSTITYRDRYLEKLATRYGHRVPFTRIYCL